MKTRRDIFTPIAQRFAELVHPEKIVFLAREENWLGEMDLLLVILPHLKRGKSRRSYSVDLYASFTDLSAYPKDGVDILVRTSQDIELGLKEHDSFLATVREKGEVLYDAMPTASPPVIKVSRTVKTPNRSSGSPVE